jgi:translocation and assembly module TamA
LLSAAAVLPLMAAAQINQPKPGQGAPASMPEPDPQQAAPATDPQGDAPIVPDAEFEAAVPSLTSDPNAPLEPIEDFAAPAPVLVQEPELAAPLPPIGQFDVQPVQIAGVEDAPATEIRYRTQVIGLDEVGLTSQFNALSALKDDDDAPNAAIVTARAEEDEGLAVRLLHSAGYYDATATSTIEQLPNEPGRVRAVLTAVPGRKYTLSSVTVNAAPTVPPELPRRELALKIGDPIDAVRIQAAEANVQLVLPQQGYAFAQVGQRDILLDEAVGTGDYTLPVEVGPRVRFAGIKTQGDLAFDADHVELLARFKPGELYDSRKVDDLRQALVATGLFTSVGVEPQRTGRPAADGTEEVDLLVQQNAGPARTLAAEGGYGTGQGIRIEGSWTHRNLFRPEGALIVRGVAGTQEQALGVTFRRSNAGQRDRTFLLQALANRSDYQAFEAFTGTLAARVSYDSTPIWQKRFTYAYGAELIGTNESVYDFSRLDRVRRTYFIGAIPLLAGFDTSDDLLNPTRGFRVNLRLSPETSIQGGTRPYVRSMIEGTAYYPIGQNMVLAGRLRAGSIAGITRDALAPSRRYYAGGGGSVRGFGFQELGPRTEEPNPKFDPTDPEEEDSPTIFRPVGGRSLNEAAIELRYRFGNFGIVPFFDVGQVYESTLPKGSDLRMGVGIGGRYYTNFGPFRIDVGTPLNRRPGESKVALYLSIGQAF